MSIGEVIKAKRIEEVLHFTTTPGLTGILHQRKVQARAFLKNDQTLAFILKLNTAKNYDPKWKEYVNLSISRINRSLFGKSENWHPDEKWRILAFDPMILTHEGVHFVTTNNAYWQHLFRGTGAASLEKLFAKGVRGVYNTLVQRTSTMPDCWTTDVQAEVLYPKAVSTEFLKKIYVRTESEADSVAGKIAALRHPEISIEVRPDRFA